MTVASSLNWTQFTFCEEMNVCIREASSKCTPCIYLYLNSRSHATSCITPHKPHAVMWFTTMLLNHWGNLQIFLFSELPARNPADKNAHPSMSPEFACDLSSCHIPQDHGLVRATGAQLTVVKGTVGATIQSLKHVKCNSQCWTMIKFALTSYCMCIDECTRWHFNYI